MVRPKGLAQATSFELQALPQVLCRTERRGDQCLISKFTIDGLFEAYVVVEYDEGLNLALSQAALQPLAIFLDFFASNYDASSLGEVQPNCAIQVYPNRKTAPSWYATHDAKYALRLNNFSHGTPELCSALQEYYNTALEGFEYTSTLDVIIYSLKLFLIFGVNMLLTRCGLHVLLSLAQLFQAPDTPLLNPIVPAPDALGPELPAPEAIPEIELMPVIVPDLAPGHTRAWLPRFEEHRDAEPGEVRLLFDSPRLEANYR